MKYSEADILEMIEGLHGSAFQDSLCNLTHSAGDSLPILMRVWKYETSPERRAMLVHALWQCRDESAFPALENALLDGEEPVWKEALDGLVALGGDRAILMLSKAKEGVADATKREWIDEAMEQVRQGQRTANQVAQRDAEDCPLQPRLRP